MDQSDFTRDTNPAWNNNIHYVHRSGTTQLLLHRRQSYRSTQRLILTISQRTQGQKTTSIKFTMHVNKYIGVKQYREVHARLTLNNFTTRTTMVKGYRHTNTKLFRKTEKLSYHFLQLQNGNKSKQNKTEELRIASHYGKNIMDST